MLETQKLKPELKELNQKSYSQLSERVKGAKEEVDKIQDLYFNLQASSVSHETEKNVLIEYMNAKESLEKQKSRVAWSKLGDQNTHFFFTKR